MIQKKPENVESLMYKAYVVASQAEKLDMKLLITAGSTAAAQTSTSIRRSCETH